MDVAAWVAAGLYDPAAPGAAARRQLLEHLVAMGATTEEMVAADRAGRLGALVGHLVRRGPGPFVSPRDLAEQGLIDPETLARVWQSGGLPPLGLDEQVLTARDVANLRSFVVGAETFGTEEMLQFTRTIGSAVAAIADAATMLFGLRVSSRLVASGVDEVQYAGAIEAGSRLLVDVVPDVITGFFLHHVDRSVIRHVAGGGDTGDAEVAYLAVGFIDLVGSTEMLHTLPAGEIAAALSDFERGATEIAARHDGRVVKTIGDEVMFVANRAVDACAIALDLVDYAAEHDALPAVRGALAWGPLVRGYGDYYGPVVNLAARAVKEAASGVVLGDVELAGQVRAAGGFTVGKPVECDLRGFADPVVLAPIGRAG